MTARPRTRGECADVPRPCPHRACRYSLLVELRKRPPSSPEASCALDLADGGEHTLAEVGAVLGVSRERIRQIEEGALEKLARRAKTIPALQETQNTNERK